jgi:hypothetical protein
MMLFLSIWNYLIEYNMINMGFMILLIGDTIIPWPNVYFVVIYDPLPHLPTLITNYYVVLRIRMVHLFVILFLIWLFYISLIKIKTLNVNTIYLAFRLLIDFKMNQMNYIYSQNDIVTISIIKLSIDQF